MCKGKSKLFLKEKSMLIDISTFSYIFALAPALILAAICLILRKKPLKVLMIVFLGYIITVAIETNIFPLRLGEMAMDSDDRLLFGFIAPIFHGFDITCMSPLVLIELSDGVIISDTH